MKRSQLKRKSELKRSEFKRRRSTELARKNARSYLKAGKKTKAWAKTRERAIKEYAEQGITRCELGYEGCWKDNALGFAHGRKRRNLQGDELKTLIILACNPCHDKIEYLGPERMLAIVENVIASRSLAA